QAQSYHRRCDTGAGHRAVQGPEGEFLETKARPEQGVGRAVPVCAVDLVIGDDNPPFAGNAVDRAVVELVAVDGMRHRTAASADRQTHEHAVAPAAMRRMAAGATRAVERRPEPVEDLH